VFNSMSAEVRNLLLVASELGGEVTQYVKVLRKEKERFLPVDEVKKQLEVATSNIATLQVTNDKYKEQIKRQSEELELMQTNRVHAEVYQNVAAERDRALDQLCARERDFLREIDKKHAELRACQVALSREQECRTELAKDLQGCIKDLEGNLFKVQTELEQMTLSRNSLRETLSSTQAEWGQLRDAFDKSEKEILRLQTELHRAQRAYDSVEDEKVAARNKIGDLHGALTAERDEWNQFVRKAIMTLGVPAAEVRRGFSREDLLTGIRSLRKDLGEREGGNLYPALESAKAKLARVAAALEAPIPVPDFTADYYRTVADSVTAAIRAPIRKAIEDE
jgi:chromosome segregation ATPase